MANAPRLITVEVFADKALLGKWPDHQGPPILWYNRHTLLEPLLSHSLSYEWATPFVFLIKGASLNSTTAGTGVRTGQFFVSIGHPFATAGFDPSGASITPDATRRFAVFLSSRGSMMQSSAGACSWSGAARSSGSRAGSFRRQSVGFGGFSGLSLLRAYFCWAALFARSDDSTLLLFAVQGQF